MLDRSNRTFICSVVFLDIAEYSKRPVAEQIRLRDRFNTVLAEAIRDVPVNDRIILDTGDGADRDVIIKLRPDLAPGHVARITELASEGFYDGVVFHRVIAGFMAQGGDPTGTGTSGSKKPNLKAEFSKERHARGVCSMARTSDPNSANSQFFICLDDASFLDGQYTVWGEVIEGMDHVDALPKGEPPRSPGKIIKATVN